jgi:hypothetical protein
MEPEVPSYQMFDRGFRRVLRWLITALSQRRGLRLAAVLSSRSTVTAVVFARAAHVLNVYREGAGVE